ncbi:glutathione ABC transporter substrate-binding protein [Halalkalibacterium halodurans]|uniref:Oligopeptide ABC transporter (Oligopeptide-binding protein) n=1 Tax=Halalkalibacterium halodurans (strain ATCC BAA-125 / DSM 18197 / FERM 7344 / JCM 9153 / C-125) TaxID=272558 RepID=Q9K8I0_HALH5|nr:glutathione ABC transporter substrate-binding protein [Halalkalibacterium halodurans]MED4082222.1 glutathione ABC transporter substrate-binding protein [Halalkalibacterium halodurans]MED4084529.1 glutathione ABC transporter substrate-binding protein [Halalkalibacterium halodurans]MED4103723.1 glutathione ABC transporter substrate-binding protein [Halalkalibacterium halodurans]MED4110191.1 glutathione ABC transporter substrate-binding protein [Halalkalibacterium halodurans]MED4123174.1 gluta
MKQWLLIVWLSAFALVGCASEPSASEQGGENEDARKGNALIIDLMSYPVSLDPHGANNGESLYVMSTMYDTLVYLDESLEIQPLLAESLEMVGDTIWEAKLRQGVTFHDDSPFNAEAVKANLERVIDPDIGSPVAFLFDMITEVEVIDEYTVHIHTEYPFAPLPSHLAHPGGHMISKEAIEADYEAMANGEEPFSYINEHPVGTGFYRYEGAQNGEYVKVVKNENYWDREQAKSDALTFKVVPEDLTRVAELETGEADIIYPVNPNDVNRIEQHHGTKVLKSPSSNLTYLGFNTTKEPFNDPLVRQAIAKAIDQEGIINGILNGMALPAKGPLAPTVFGYDDQFSAAKKDVEEAKALLDEAGYPNGFETTIVSNDTRAFMDIAVFVQQELQAIGIDVQVETVETSTFLELAGNGDTEMFVSSWGTVTLDADYGLYPMFHSENAGFPGNRTFFANEELDDLLERARKETDEATRLELYKDAQQIIVDEVPLVFLYHSELLAGLGEQVEGFWQYPSSIFYMRDAVKR